MVATILLSFALVSGAPPVAQNQEEVEAIRFSWRKLPKTIIPSGTTTQQMRDAQLDARLREEYKKIPPDLAVIEELERLKKNQVPPLDAPKASDKAYEYKFQFKNRSSKRVISLSWVYLFIDALTKEELVRLGFEGKIKIGPGKEKKFTTYRDSSPPMVVNAEAQEREGKAWIEKVIIEKIEYSDGSKWERKR